MVLVYLVVLSLFCLNVRAGCGTVCIDAAQACCGIPGVIVVVALCGG